LNVAKAVTLSSTLNVDENATFTKHIGVTDISAGRFQTGKLIMEDQYAGANYQNYIRSTAGDISIRAGNTDGSPYGNVIIKSNLIVDGSINFSGTITQTDVKIQVSDQLDISANNIGYEALKVQQNASTGTVATFYNNVTNSSVPVFVVGYNHVTINKTTASANYEFDVSGNAQISSNLKVGGVVKFDTTLTVDGNYSSAAGNLTLTAGKITGATLEITSTSTFTGKVTMNGGIDMAADTFINQIGTEVW
jgi:cytoskeletal protein CcmA (bactofilin family)